MHVNDYLEDLRPRLKNANIVISSHFSPDGDAIGSCLALAHYLRKRGNNVSVIIADEIPRHLRWLPGAEEIIKLLPESQEAPHIQEKFTNADLLICVDINELRRLGRVANRFKQLDRARQRTVVIDHHIVLNRRVLRANFDYAFLNAKACSTAILLYEFIHLMQDEFLLDTDIATCLYAGMLTDTNNFSTSNVDANVHRVVAELLSFGVLPNQVYCNLHSYTATKLQLLGEVLANRIYYDPQSRFAVIKITKDDFTTFNIKNGDTEGIINYALLLEDVDIAVLLTERENAVRLSIRSRNDRSSLKFAMDNFGGGGHVYASGAVSKLPLDETFNRVIDILTVKP